METSNVALCENYQLKWSSYNSYIHSCIASSLINDESFADVALVTMDGHKIMAHRFILSYASQYLNKALKFLPKVTSALPLMIVLPQAITYKALKILVKYMYSGETTVTKDILEVVIKAGEILKVKGLYHEPNTGGKQDDKNTSVSGPFADNDSLITLKNDSKGTGGSNHVTPQLYVNSNTSSSQKIFKNQIEESKSKLESSNLLHKSSKLHHLNKSSPSLKSYHKGQKVLNFTMTNFNGTIKKENNTESKPIISIHKKVTKQQSDKPHTITSAEAAAAESSSSSAAVTATATVRPDDHLLSSASSSSNTQTNNNNNNNINYDDDNDDQDEDNDTKSNIADTSYLMIKNEPLDWPEEPDNMDIVNDDKVQFPEEIVKTEAFDDSASNDEEPQSDLYTPLTCELCTASFTIPAEWVKHVQTHTDMLPAKRRRRDSPEIEDDNASYPQLQCDLCEKSFPTPAEWVHHIQDTHTEFELSLFNRRTNQMKKNDLNKYKFVVN